MFGASHAGIFTLGNKGQFEYIHDCNDSDNEDYIIYYVNDGTLNSLVPDTAIIYIVNEAPFGEPDFYSVHNSQTLNVDSASGPIFNDLDSNEAKTTIKTSISGIFSFHNCR